MNHKRYAAVLLAMLLFTACAETETNTRENNTTMDTTPPLPAREKSSNNSTHTPESEKKKGAETLGWYETKLLDAGKPRITNITLSMKKINGMVLQPNEEFSFNNTVGRRTINRGFKKATIFRKNKEVKEVGGGICQLSSTLYCAVKQANLKVTERHEHQLPVDYVKQGDDATVYYGELDFKFVNSLDVPIKITCGIKDRKVQVGIATVSS